MKDRRSFALAFIAVLAAAGASNALALESDQLPKDALQNAHVQSMRVTPHAHLNGQAHARFGIPNIDSVVNWNDQFFADGFDSFGNPNRHWYTNTVGNPPQHHGTTFINAPIVPVIVDMRNADGSPRFVGGTRLVSDPTPLVQLLLDSPIFSNARWSSSPVPTQITDAIQRAQYFATAKDDWHTIVVPSVKAPRTMVLIEGTYQFSLNDDGSCCFFVIVDDAAFIGALFPATATDATTPVGAAENAGDITTKDLSTFLFSNTFLYPNGDPSECCSLGFHTYDFEPADPKSGDIEKRYVLMAVPWISAGVLNGSSFGLEDINALSHDMAEMYNDPFLIGSDGVHNVTPWWFDGFLCANYREGGDVAFDTGYPDKISYPILMPNGITYHPQNVTLLQWFAREFPSSALHGTYSYPDEAATQSLGPPNLKPGC